MNSDGAHGPSRSLFASLVALSRWREHVPYVVPLTLIGALAAGRATGNTPGWNVALVLLANVLANCVAFMVNDIEDAEDDAKDPGRGYRNVVATGELGRSMAWAASLTFALVSFILYVLASQSDGMVMLCGAVILLLAILYSWSPVRLKAIPGLDVLSHSLMLGGLLLLAGYLTLAPLQGPWIAPVAAVTLVSAYGQFYNQLRDLETDRQAGLRNTALCLGRNATWFLLYACLAGGAICLAILVFRSIVPLWAFGVLALSALASWRLRARASVDMRGATALDRTGEAQRPTLDGLNAMAFAWLVTTIISQ